MQGLTFMQMQKITLQHFMVEAKFNCTKEKTIIANAKVFCLCQQKKLWAGKMVCAVCYNFDTIEKLKHIKAKKAKAEHQTAAEASRCAKEFIFEGFLPKSFVEFVLADLDNGVGFFLLYSFWFGVKQNSSFSIVIGLFNNTGGVIGLDFVVCIL